MLKGLLAQWRLLLFLLLILNIGALFIDMFRLALVCHMSAIAVSFYRLAVTKLLGRRYRSSSFSSTRAQGSSNRSDALVFIDTLCAAFGGFLLWSLGMGELFVLAALYNVYVGLAYVVPKGNLLPLGSKTKRVRVDSSRPRESSLKPGPGQQPSRCVVLDEGPHFNRTCRGCLL